MEERSTDLNILPTQYQEFTNKQYWDRFFQQLNEKTFEWYGKTDEIYPLISSVLRNESKMLMIGCGNSNFSSDLYDSGYHSIANVDYSDVVIQEMKRKNESARPEMSWDVGDVTDLSQLYKAGQFDIVLDKGTLDAILSENTAELVGKTRSMFREISRVLNDHGTYICISLAQDFILHYLLEAFLPSAWDIEVGYIHQMSGSALGSSSSSSSSGSSPLHPFVFKICKKTIKSSIPITLSSAAKLTGSEEVKVQMDPMGNPYPHLQSKPLDLHQLPNYIRHIQEFYLLKHSTRTFEIGKFETLHFWTSEKAAMETIPTTTSSLDSIPRYTLYILDANAQGNLQMAVFIIPFGRESDYQFTSKDGLLDLAFQANCKRLIAVSCNRPYPYPQLKTLQNELSPIILSLKLSTMSDREFIPYMAISHDHTWEVIAQGDSNVSGIYIIEEKSDAPVKSKKRSTKEGVEGEDQEQEEEEGEDEKKTGVYRRLIFLQNQQFVQTEVHLIDPSIQSKEKNTAIIKKKKSSASNSSSKKKKNQSGKAKAGSDSTIAKSDISSSLSTGESSSFVFDYQYLDDHHKAFLLSICLNDALVRSVSLPFTSTASTASSFPQCLLIGLGGGSLPMIIHKYYPSLRMRIVEIDEVVYDLAKQYFGYSVNPEVQEVVIEEGVHYIQQQYQQLLATTTATNTIEDQVASLSLSPSLTNYYDVIAIDVDCKDPSLGLSAPPKEFISNDTLHKLYALLSPSQGMLLINTVARNKSLFQQLIDRLKIIFQVSPSEVTTLSSHKTTSEGRILQLQANAENVNICLICLKNGDMPFLPRQASSAPATNGKKKSGGGGVGGASMIGDKKFTKNQLQIKLQVNLEQSLHAVLSNARDAQDSLSFTPLIEKFQIL